MFTNKTFKNIYLLFSGELTRDQLSALLLTHLGTASDIVDFMSILSEPNIVRTGGFLYAVLVMWTWSLCQVCIESM